MYAPLPLSNTVVRGATLIDPNALRAAIAELEQSLAQHTFALSREHELLADLRRQLRQQTHNTAVPPDLQQIVEAQPGPACIVDRHYRVQAVNDADRALEGGRCIIGQNAAELVLLAEIRMRMPQMEHLAGLIVGSLHATLDHSPDDLELRRLIRRLTERYPHFGVLWSGHKSAEITGYTLTRASPLDGADLVLDYSSLPVHGWPGSRILIGTAKRGTPTRARLDRLMRRLDQAHERTTPTSRGYARRNDRVRDLVGSQAARACYGLLRAPQSRVVRQVDRNPQLRGSDSGAIAQLAERLLCKQEVRSSNLRGSTSRSAPILIMDEGVRAINVPSARRDENASQACPTLSGEGVPGVPKIVERTPFRPNPASA
jgi:hypothetical protein